MHWWALLLYFFDASLCHLPLDKIYSNRKCSGKGMDIVTCSIDCDIHFCNSIEKDLLYVD